MIQYPYTYRSRLAFVSIYLWAALLVNGCAAADYLRAGVQAQSEYYEGLERYNASQYDQAVAHFERALSLQSDYDDAESYLAWSYYHSGSYQKAARHFQQVIARQPEWEGLYNGLGWSLFHTGDYHQAMKAFRQALARDGQYRDAAVGYASAEFELGHYAAALPQLERLVQEGEAKGKRKAASDLDELRSRYAWALFYLGDYRRAADQFAKGIATRPQWSGLHNGLGWSRLRLGDTRGARQAFQQALALEPDLEDAKEGLAQLTK